MPPEMTRKTADGARSSASSVAPPISDSQDTGTHNHNEPLPPNVDSIDDGGTGETTGRPPRRIAWPRVAAFGLLPGLALLLAVSAGILKWQASSMADSTATATEAVQAAKDSTVAILSYRPGSVDTDLARARERLTGSFRDSYTALANNVVIPGARQKQISAVATVPGAAPVSANKTHAVVMVLVNQTIVAGSDAPTNTASVVKVTLDEIGGRWLISEFEPV